MIGDPRFKILLQSLLHDGRIANSSANFGPCRRIVLEFFGILLFCSNGEGVLQKIGAEDPEFPVFGSNGEVA